MGYVIVEITFSKYDEDGNQVLDVDGNPMLFEPKGRWKQLEYLTDGCDDSDFQLINKEVMKGGV